MKNSIVLSLLVAATLLAGCEDTPPPPPVTTATPVASASASAQAEVGTVTVKLDGVALEVEVGPTPKLLVEVLPEAGRDPTTWRELSAKSVDGKRTMGVRQFTEKYGSHDVKLYLDDKGRPSVGIFRRLRDNMPTHVKNKLKKPHIMLVDAATVDVRTKEREAEEPKGTQVTVLVAGAEKPLELSKLRKLKKQSPPGEKKGEGRGQRRKRKRRGWPLQDVIAMFANLDQVKHVKLVTTEQDSLMIKGDALRDGSATVLMRMNNRGALGASSWDKDQETPRRVRGVSKIIIADQ